MTFSRSNEWGVVSSLSHVIKDTDRWPVVLRIMRDEGITDTYPYLKSSLCNSIAPCVLLLDRGFVVDLRFFLFH